MNNQQSILLGALVSILTFTGLNLAFGVEIADITNYKTYEEMQKLQPNTKQIETFDTVIINLDTFKAEYQNNYVNGFEFLHLLENQQETKTLEISEQEEEKEKEKDKKSDQDKDDKKDEDKDDKETKKETDDPRFNDKYDDIDWMGDEGEKDMTLEEMDKHLEDRKDIEENQEKNKDIQLPLDGTVIDEYERVDITSEQEEDKEQQYDHLFNWASEELILSF